MLRNLPSYHCNYDLEDKDDLGEDEVEDILHVLHDPSVIRGCHPGVSPRSDVRFRKFQRQFLLELKEKTAPDKDDHEEDEVKDILHVLHDPSVIRGCHPGASP